MKKLLLLLLALSLLVSSCSTVHWQIGQSQDAFFQLNKSHKRQFEVVRQTSEWSIYKIAWDDRPYFFYFQNDALNMVDRGERSADIIIQTR
jgi:uncharacterized protein YceK